MAEPAVEFEPVADAVDPETSLRELADTAAELLDADDAAGLRSLFEALHPADGADVVEQLTWEQQVKLATITPDILTGELLSELVEDTRADLMAALEPEHIAEAIQVLDSDDMTMIVEELETDLREKVLDNFDDAGRQILEASLLFGEETAGRLMQREFVAAPRFWTVGDTIDHMRRAGEDLPDRFFEVFIVDEGFHPIGSVAVSRLMRSRRETPLSEILETPQVVIQPDLDQEEVAYMFQKYHLISAPVVDENGRLNGMLTVDDVVDVIQEENKEDMLALAGVSDAGLADTVYSSVRARAPWLLVNLGTAVLASAVIALFESAISQLVALAVLMPIVASMGGNAGTQSLAVAVRAIASRSLTGANSRRVIVRELAAGAVNGLIFAIVMGAVAGLWFRDFDIAWVIGLAMIVTLAAAGLSGILIPLGLRKMGADPAVASSVFVTTVTDVVGFFVFLGLGAMVLL